MKKTRIQPALATLSPEDKNQLADWLRKADYLVVLERVRKPRADGGLGLGISKKPLQTFYAKVMLLDAINARLPDERKIGITDFENIANAERLLASAIRSEQDSNVVSEDVHDAIMGATYDLATSGDNTPTQLLALQRLADFPERAELRAQKAEIELRKDQRAADAAQFRKEMGEKRFALAERAQAFREKMATARVSRAESRLSPDSPREDALGRLARNLDDVERRVCAQFNLPYDGPSQSSPLPEPSGSLDCGGSTPLSVAPEAPDTSEPINSETRSEVVTSELSQPATTSAQPLSDPQPATSNLEPPDGSSRRREEAHEITPPNPVASTQTQLPDQQPATSKPQPGKSIPEKTKSHAIRRWRSHIRWPAGTPEPDGSWRDECPCGNQAPCTEHPELKARVRYYRPQLPDYIEGLQQFNVPYYKPTAEEIGCTQEDLDKSCDPFAYNPRMKDPPDPRFAPDWLRPSS